MAFDDADMYEARCARLMITYDCCSRSRTSSSSSPSATAKSSVAWRLTNSKSSSGTGVNSTSTISRGGGATAGGASRSRPHREAEVIAEAVARICASSRRRHRGDRPGASLDTNRLAREKTCTSSISSSTTDAPQLLHLSPRILKYHHPRCTISTACSVRSAVRAMCGRCSVAHRSRPPSTLDLGMCGTVKGTPCVVTEEDGRSACDLDQRAVRSSMNGEVQVA